MKLFKIISLIAVLSLCEIELIAQDNLNLDILRLQETEANTARIKRVNQYAERFGVPVMSRDTNGNLVLLVDVTTTGQPLYETTDNAGAAITTGVDKLRSGSALGLNLEGEGMEIGVWDGGIVNGHLEFGDRILLREGSTEDTHATHVTGTIIASGINPLAKGMAPKGRVFAFDFSNDTPEMLSMAREDQSGLIISNHSYGLITGWRFNNGWQWFGDVSISSFEDWKFGYYSNAARQWDQLAFNSPYYLIVKSAGNDRTDTGGGNFPADCNGGSGYDCLSDKSVAKNILTIGAVNKVTDYQGPSSVVMSSFSSWGPTDDGRIKPDLVAAGVNLFSTYSSATNDAYGPLSGTSMATPNATGSLALLQELHKNLNNGNYMKASTLKALAIHTAKEAGVNPGPDYQNGWGLLDVEEGARVLLNNDNKNVYILEENLLNGQPFELVLNPIENTKIKATLVWADPAGVPVGASLDPINPMLINDLDLRLVDDATNSQFPWKLDRQNFEAPATKGDNILDNVEKLEFASPEPREYKLVVSNKGSLLNGAQSFSLTIEYTSTSAQQTSLYWIGSNGNWNDSNNWSLTSGGPSASIVPDAQHKVIVDENSFSSVGQYIDISSNSECHSIIWLAKNESGISLNGNRLTIYGEINIASSNFKTSTSGEVLLRSDQASLENRIKLNGADFKSVKFILDDVSGKWLFTSGGQIGEINLKGGVVDLGGKSFSIKRLISSSSLAKELILANATIEDVESLDLQSDGLALNTDRTIIRTASMSEFSFGINSYNGSISSEGVIRIVDAEKINSLDILGNIEFLNNTEINLFKVFPGSVITISSGKEITLSQDLNILATSEKNVIFNTSELTPAGVSINGHFKLCFDFLNIDNVDFVGSAIVNAGVNSSISQASGWIQDACENVIFPDFDFNFPCVGALTKFSDKSSGLINNWKWDFGTNAPQMSEIKNPMLTFDEENIFNVTLTVSNEANSQSYTRQVAIIPNPLQENEIILSNSTLFSFKSAAKYEWYRNGIFIEDSNVRSIVHNGLPGVYFVVTEIEGCNKVSDSFVITDTHETPEGIVFPNPATKKLYTKLEVKNGTINISDVTGKVWFTGSTLELEANGIDVETWPIGIYIIQIKDGTIMLNTKFLKK